MSKSGPSSPGRVLMPGLCKNHKPRNPHGDRLRTPSTGKLADVISHTMAIADTSS
jgi:hypothetical protein